MAFAKLFISIFLSSPKNKKNISAIFFWQKRKASHCTWKEVSQRVGISTNLFINNVSFLKLFDVIGEVRNYSSNYLLVLQRQQLICIILPTSTNRGVNYWTFKCRTVKLFKASDEKNRTEHLQNQLARLSLNHFYAHLEFHSSQRMSIQMSCQNQSKHC